VGSVAAPLLASVSAALATLVVPNEEAFRWPNLTVFLLVGATLVLVAAVQFGFRARQYIAMPSDLEQWWPIEDAAGIDLRRQIQRYHATKHQAWATAAGHAYNAGLLCFLLGLALITIPPGNLGGYRLAVTALALLGALAEAAWIVYTRVTQDADVLLPEVGPEWTPSISPDTEGDG